MKFLLDVCLGTYLEQHIIAQFEDDFLCVRDLNPRMLDVDILALANEQERIIITADKDFGDLVFQSRLKHTGILLMRFDECTFDEKCEILAKVLEYHKETLPYKFAVYQDHKIRIR